MSISKKSTKQLPNTEMDASVASLKDLPKKDTYHQKKENKLLMN